MNPKQQQFVLRFCAQLASVIEACEQHDSAEIEIGRRQVGIHQVKVKLMAEREKSFAAPIGSHGSGQVNSDQNK